MKLWTSEKNTSHLTCDTRNQIANVSEQGQNTVAKLKYGWDQPLRNL